MRAPPRADRGPPAGRSRRWQARVDRAIGQLADDSGDALQPGQTCCPDTALASDELEALQRLRDEDGLEDAVLSRSRQARRAPRRRCGSAAGRDSERCAREGSVRPPRRCVPLRDQGCQPSAEAARGALRPDRHGTAPIEGGVGIGGLGSARRHGIRVIAGGRVGRTATSVTGPELSSQRLVGLGALGVGPVQGDRQPMAGASESRTLRAPSCRTQSARDAGEPRRPPRRTGSFDCRTSSARHRRWPDPD